MNAKNETMFSIAAAIFLFTAMLDPRIVIVIAVIFLLLMSAHKFTRTS